MDWGYKAVLTAMTVATVLMTAAFFGRRLAGLVAGLPVITAPTLLWLALEEGSAFAARSAVGSVAACGAAAVFALVYERAARRRGPLPTLAFALAGGGVMALLLARLTAGPQGLPIALSAAGGLGFLALRILPTPAAGTPPLSRLRGQLPLTALLAGVVSALLAVAAPWLGAFWAGLLGSLPIISLAALLHQHRHATQSDRQQFLRGYAAGLLGTAAFASVFGAAVIPLGTLLALGAALVAGGCATLALARPMAGATRASTPSHRAGPARP